ncbi:MAG: twin-arginine translocation signal domain-containing protein [Haloarculaceae archaeon]
MRQESTTDAHARSGTDRARSAPPTRRQFLRASAAGALGAVALVGESAGQPAAKHLVLRSTGAERAHYEFTVSGSLDPGSKVDPHSAVFRDLVSRSSARGSVQDHGVDDYWFTGDIVEFHRDGPLAYDVSSGGSGAGPGDGPAVDPGSGSLARSITVRSTGTSVASYGLFVDGQLRAGSHADRHADRGPDVIQGQRAFGTVDDRGVDDFTFAGDVQLVAVHGPVEVQVDGERVRPTVLPHTARIESTGTDVASYRFRVSDVIVPGVRANLRASVGPDGVSDALAVASGTVAGRGVDDYHFAGRLGQCRVDGPADLVVDGAQYRCG